MTVQLEVLASGPFATVQDLGRHGCAYYGIAPSGAADRSALRLANQLVDNPAGAAALEVTLGGLRLRPGGPVRLALTGAPCPTTVDGRSALHNTAFLVAGGEELRLRSPPWGVRTYVAVRGGVGVPAVLGSRSTDVLAGVGPDVVRAGAVLPVGDLPAEPPGAAVAPPPDPVRGDLLLRVVLGPRAHWFSAAARAALGDTRWMVTPDSNRVGLRLSGGELERVVQSELPSEGLVRGALQVPPYGLPTLLLADHPLTGGYPVIAVVIDADVDRAGQVRPGQHVRFARVPGPMIG